MTEQTSLQIKEQLKNIEQELSLFRKVFVSFLSLQKTSCPKTDKEIWQEIKEDYENIQEKLFKEQYPSLYAKLKK